MAESIDERKRARKQTVTEERMIGVGGGVRLHVLTAGPAGTAKGTPVLLLHGFPQSSYAWREIITPLVDAGYRVIVPDMRGYGLSDKPRRTKDYASPVLVSDMKNLLTALGHDRAHVVGHDWGGVVAWRFAASHPELVDRLVIINGPHPDRMAERLRHSAAQRKRSWYIFFFQLPWLPERFLARRTTMRRLFMASAFKREAFTDEAIDTYTKAVRQPGAARGMLSYYRAAARWPTKRLPQIERPTLVLWGERDTALGADLLDRLGEHVRDLRVHRIHDASHWVVEEKPELVVSELTAFFSANQPS